MALARVLCVGVALAAFSCSANRSAAPRVAPADLSELPLDALGTQRLLRAQVRGPEGDASLRIVLRIATAERFEVDAADIAGRPVWSLRVDGDAGLLLDSRNLRYCRLSHSVSLPGGLGLKLPLVEVPRLLLGRLPVQAPPGATEARQGDDRRWTWSARGGELEQWMLWEKNQPAVWFVRSKGEAVLSIRARATQLRWREALVEPLREKQSPLAALSPPHDFDEGACNADDLP